MEFFVTSDFHFNHYNIIKYCKRPFKNVQGMNIAMIKRFNSRVKSEDVVFFLGDFSLVRSRKKYHMKVSEILKKLNGNIILIQGNHCKNNKVKTIIKGIHIKYGGASIYLTHRPQDIKFKYDMNIVGHNHLAPKIKQFKRGRGSTVVMNASVDMWDFYPTKLKTAIKYYNRLTKRKNTRKKKTKMGNKKRKRINGNRNKSCQ